MLLSHKHRFIFLKTYKTGGTSIEILLSRFMGEHDVITPATLDDEVIRFRYGAYPRNWQRMEPAAEALASLPDIQTDEQAEAFLRHTQTVNHFTEHMQAKEVRERIPEIIWDNYLKITAERHPYEKVVSMAYYRSYRHGGTLTIGEYIDEVIARRCGRNFNMYTIDGRIVADCFIRFEHFEEDIRRLLERLNLPLDAEIPRAKAMQRTDQRPAIDILTQEQKAVIQQKCREEFEHFGYAP